MRILNTLDRYPGTASILAIVLGLILVVGNTVFAQVPAPIPEAPGRFGAETSPSTGGASNIFLTDRVASRRLQLAQQRLNDEIFDEAVDLIQAVLDVDEDVVAPSEDAATFRSLKREAHELLARMPPDGRRIYEVKYGIAAKSQLDDAIETGDWKAVEAVSRRFFNTAAGMEATYRLAVRAQDRGESLQAALLLSRLQELGETAFEPELSLRAAIAWHKAGMDEPARRAAERFLRLASGHKETGQLTLPAAGSSDELLSWIRRSSQEGSDEGTEGWPTLGGSVDRNAAAESVTVAGGTQWTHTLHAPMKWNTEREAITANRLASGLSLYTLAATQRGELTQPAFHPVASGDIAVFRSLLGLQAVDIDTGEFLWGTEHPHDQLFDIAMEELSSFIDEGTEPTENEDLSGLDGLTSQKYIAQTAWRDLTTGTLSTDGRFVYGIEGTGFAKGGPRAVGRGAGGRIKAVGEETFNSLFAYEIAAEGRIAWIAGGVPEGDATTGTFFLGPPLPLGQRLYALAEEEGEIRLLVLDPLADDANRVLWSQTLVSAEHPLANDPLRRISGLSPAFVDGVLICPTGAGAAVAVDLGQKTLRWGYRYEPNWTSGPPVPGRILLNNIPSTPGPRDENERWLDAVPRIADGAVFLTPRDSDALHCLDLHDGRLRWRHPRGTMLYLATIHNGFAVLVGRGNVVALDVDTGETVWEQSLPADTTPAGRGVHDGEMYRLPLDSGMIASIRLSTGRIVAQSPLGNDVMPGNLISANGRLLSLSTRTIAGFHEAESLLRRFEEAVNEKDAAEVLALRGEDRLHRGDIEAGLADLRAAVARGHVRAKATLANALLKGLKEDFSAHRKYENDLHALVDSPQERADFHRLFADGLFEAGDYVNATEAYLRLTDENVAAPQPEPVTKDRYVRSDRIIQVRMNKIYEAAPPSDREEIVAVLRNSLREAAASVGPGRLERLAALATGTPIERDVLDELLRCYVATNERLLAERVRLRIGGEPRSSASNEERSAQRIASDLGSDVAGADAYQVEYRPDEIGTGHPSTQVRTTFDVEVVGTRPQELEDWHFEIDDLRRFLVARDPVGRKQWAVSLNRPNEPNAPLQGVGGAQIRFSGHIMALTAGTSLIVFDTLSDPSQPRRLWSRNLATGHPEVLAINRRVFGGPRYPMSGPIGFAGPDLLLYQSGSVVTAADPTTGEVLWQRGKMPSGCELAGTAEKVVLQPPQSSTVLICDSTDGSEVASRRIPDSLFRLGWNGTRLITWQQEKGELLLSCREATTDDVVWSHAFPRTSLQAGLGSEKCVVLDPSTGQVSVIRWTDGRVLMSAEIEADPAIDAFLPIDLLGRYVIFTHKPEPPDRVRIERDRSRFLARGMAYAFADDGTRQWSTLIARQCISTTAPAALPLLFLSAKIHRDEQPPIYEAAVLDVRTGRIIAEQTRQNDGFLPYRFSVDASAGSIEILVPDARFLVTRADHVTSGEKPARADGKSDND